MMFPRYFRWISAFGVLAALVVLVIMALPVVSGMAPASDLIRPVIAAVAFGWAFTQSTKA
ncbi:MULTISPECIES: hypothetical protein [Pseudomonas]|uniref:Uncharacterized protein n=1 Tax=Pseudomonas sessilinigenes TaxID=658629 RepID=A0ABX8MZB8_9PSED|nr:MULTISPECIES: hypothetical protein [Pseudomonas]QIH05135.1 hypothetical protein ATY02_15015 [Pseudomonas sp. BIOMIG1BAC]QXH43888.1 hypothetical protein KSS89_23930 [Pseudomonas sessilinigenes]